MSDKKIYIVQLQFYDEAVVLGAHSTLKSAKEEIHRILMNNHEIGNFYGEEWDKIILVRNLNKDYTDDTKDIVIYERDFEDDE